jgi:hypothetical protein
MVDRSATVGSSGRRVDNDGMRGSAGGPTHPPSLHHLGTVVVEPSGAVGPASAGGAGSSGDDTVPSSHQGSPTGHQTLPTERKSP